MNTLQPSESSQSAAGFRAFRSLRNPAYRFYLPGSLFQFASLSMQIVTGPLLMYRLTNSTALLGLMSLLSSLPMIFISIYGGAIADRVSKKKIIIIGLLGSAVISFLLALALFKGLVSPDIPGSWWMVIVAVVIQGCLMGIMMPALQAVVADITKREELMNAVALNTFGMNILSLIAPSLAGLMIDTWDFSSVYFLMTGMYLLSSLVILLMPIKYQFHPLTSTASSLLNEIRSGFIYIRKNSLIFTILVFSLLATILSMPYQQLLPVFVDDILKVGATGMGVLMSVSGAGALVASAGLTLLPNRKRGLLLLLSGLISGGALVVFSSSSVWGLSLGAMVFLGMGHTFRMTISSTLLQANADPGYRGRVMSIFSLQWGLMGLCTFVAGIIAETQPVQWVLGILAALLVLATLIMMVFVTRLRKLE